MHRSWLTRAAVCGSALAAVSALACDSVETTGDDLITFKAYAAGPGDANGGQLCGPNGSGSPLTLVQPAAVGGYQVTITSAKLQIGAVYFDEGAYNGGSQNSSCFELGTYCGEVPGGVPEVNGSPGLDLLCPDPTEFSVIGNGTADVAGTGEVWLTGGQHMCARSAGEGGTGDADTPVCSASSPDINAMMDTTPIVELTGFACPPEVTPCTANAKGALNFEATVTISQVNRGVPASNPALPGDDPICKQRIVEEFDLNMPLFPNGTLYVRADPRGWFGEIDFRQNPPCPIGGTPTCGTVCCGLQEVQAATANAPALYQILDTNASTIGSQLFGGILGGTLPSGSSVYSFEFTKSE
jgi:hypothetical protein